MDIISVTNELEFLESIELAEARAEAMKFPPVFVATEMNGKFFHLMHRPNSKGGRDGDTRYANAWLNKVFPMLMSAEEIKALCQSKGFDDPILFPA